MFSYQSIEVAESESGYKKPALIFTYVRFESDELMVWDREKVI